jgi:hypothetical protein
VNRERSGYVGVQAWNWTDQWVKGWMSEEVGNWVSVKHRNKISGDLASSNQAVRIGQVSQFT